MCGPEPRRPFHWSAYGLLFIRDRPSVVPRRGNVVVIGDSVREGIRSRVLWTLMAVVAAASMAKTGAAAHRPRC